jgi:hypothetical protein
MTATRERLQFEYDLHDPSYVVKFPEAFAAFLARNSTPEDVDAFLVMLTKYVQSTGQEDLNFATICNIAAQFADLIDISGVGFDENTYLSAEGAQSAEDVLAQLDEEAEQERDTPIEVAPDFPQVEVIVKPGDHLPDVLISAVIGLKDCGFRKGAAMLVKDARGLLRTDSTMIEMLRLIESYVFVDYDPALASPLPRERKLRLRR